MNGPIQCGSLGGVSLKHSSQTLYTCFVAPAIVYQQHPVSAHGVSLDTNTTMPMLYFIVYILRLSSRYIFTLFLCQIKTLLLLYCYVVLVYVYH